MSRPAEYVSTTTTRKIIPDPAPKPEGMYITTGRATNTRFTDFELEKLDKLIQKMQSRLKRHLSRSLVLRSITRIEGTQGLKALEKAIIKTIYCPKK